MRLGRFRVLISAINSRVNDIVLGGIFFALLFRWFTVMKSEMSPKNFEIRRRFTLIISGFSEQAWSAKRFPLFPIEFSFFEEAKFMNCVYDAKDPRILVRNPHFLRDRKRGTCNTRQTRTEADIRVKMMPKTGLNGLFRAKYNPSCGFLVKLDLDLGSMEKRRSK